jgi:hypothetical protein
MDELLRSLPGPHFEKTQVGRAFAEAREFVPRSGPLRLESALTFFGLQLIVKQ